MNNILVTGSSGQLGSEIKNLSKKYVNYNFVFTDVNSLDIVNFDAVDSFIASNKIHTIINCAAYTNVDGAEENEKLANLVNFKAVENLATIAKKYELKLIHISTDYVFDGESSKAYVETDLPNPKNVYGASKLKGEQAMLGINPKNSMIIRTSWLYSSYGANFVKTIAKLLNEKETLNVVNDQIGSPTYAKDLAHAILQILSKINNTKVEIYHYANSGSCSWFQFAKEIAAFTKSDCKLVEVSSNFFNAKAKRPSYSILNTQKISTKFQLKIVPWQEALKGCLHKIN